MMLDIVLIPVEVHTQGRDVPLDCQPDFLRRGWPRAIRQETSLLETMQPTIVRIPTARLVEIDTQRPTQTS